MLDPYVRPFIDPPLDFMGKKFFSYGISPNSITFVGFIFGILSMILIACEHYNTAILFILMNRFSDGLDGAVARHQSLSEFGGFLDIVCDFIIYSGIVFAFGIANPDNLFYIAFLLFSFIGPISSFLAYAIIAAKKQINTTRRGKKSFYYLGGICEGTETFATLILLCIFPHNVNLICLVYGILCWLTTFGRIYRAWNDFSYKRKINT